MRHRLFSPLGLLLLLTIMLLMVSSTSIAQIPSTTQTAYFFSTGMVDATFYLGSSGRYKIQFVEVQDNIWPTYIVTFKDASDPDHYIALKEFWETTPECQGAETVSLVGGINYIMHIEYPIGQGNPPNPGLICKAKIFYTCGGS